MNGKEAVRRDWPFPVLWVEQGKVFSITIYEKSRGRL